MPIQVRAAVRFRRRALRCDHPPAAAARPVVHRLVGRKEFKDAIRDIAAEGGSLKEALMNLADKINV
jgi:hypothetical protein